MNKIIKGWKQSDIERKLSEPISSDCQHVPIDDDLMEVQPLKEAIEEIENSRFPE